MKISQGITGIDSIKYGCMHQKGTKLTWSLNAIRQSAVHTKGKGWDITKMWNRPGNRGKKRTTHTKRSTRREKKIMPSRQKLWRGPRTKHILHRLKCSWRVELRYPVQNAADANDTTFRKDCPTYGKVMGATYMCPVRGNS